MTLRVFGIVIALALGVVLAPLSSDAQQPKKVRRIGFLYGGSTSFAAQNVQLVRQGLSQLGWIEGENIVIETRYAEGRYEKLPELAAELVRLKVDVIVAVTNPEILAAKQATTTIPIVMAISASPVEQGFIAILVQADEVTR